MYVIEIDVLLLIILEVPQGSVVGRFFLLIDVGDIDSAAPNVSAHLFADDNVF